MKNSKVKLDLLDLPTEIHVYIFSFLKNDKCTSACLGLASAKLYPVHKALHGTVSLLCRTPAPAVPKRGPQKKFALLRTVKNWVLFSKKVYSSGVSRSLQRPSLGKALKEWNDARRVRYIGLGEQFCLFQLLKKWLGKDAWNQRLQECQCVAEARGFANEDLEDALMALEDTSQWREMVARHQEITDKAIAHYAPERFKLDSADNLWLR